MPYYSMLSHIILLSFFTIFIRFFFNFREMEREGEREGEKQLLVVFHICRLGTSPQPKCVLTGTETVTFSFVEWRPTNWATLVRVQYFFNQEAHLISKWLGSVFLGFTGIPQNLHQEHLAYGIAMVEGTDLLCQMGNNTLWHWVVISHLG